MTVPPLLSDTLPDAPAGNWVDRWLPASIKPYAQLARLDRPIGWWLLLWPCWWSLALAGNAAGRSYPSPWYLLLFFIGAVAMRGAGCTYNDIVDRRIDAEVARTRSRPIPSGRVSAGAAAVFTVAQCLIGLAVLLNFNAFAIVLGFASMLPVLVYPFMKRISSYPQVVLGLSFSWGALMGWAAVFGSLGIAPVALYAASVIWTFGYDTIYAHQDREDDELVGLGSTARVFSNRTPQMLIVAYGATTVLIAIALLTSGAGLAAYAGLCAFAIHLASQILRFDQNDGDRCLRLFKSNKNAGWLLFAGLIADGLLG